MKPPTATLMVIHHLRQGGAERQLVELALGLARRGERVTIACIDQPGIELTGLREAGVRVLGLGAAGRLRRLLAVPRLARLARRMDVVHCTMWDASLWGRLAAMLARRPVIVADHATDRSVQRSLAGARRDSWIALHNRLLDPFTYATVACAKSQLPLLESEGVLRERIVLIPNGVPVAELRRSARKGPTREQLGIPDGAKVVVHVAHFRPEKNQAATLELVAALREDLPDVHALFVGGGDRERVESEAKRIGAGWAHFLGRRSDVASLLALSDLLVLPSRSDTMPMALLESMALGVPFVATDVGDVPWLVARTGAGLCVPTGNTAALHDACFRILADERLARGLSEAATAGIYEFDANRMLDRYSMLFAAAADGLAPPGGGDAASEVAQ